MPEPPLLRLQEQPPQQELPPLPVWQTQSSKQPKVKPIQL